MGILRVLSIQRNIGALSQAYRIEYRLSSSSPWIPGPTLSYDQAQPAPAGLLPLDIVINEGGSKVITTRVVLICNHREIGGTPQDVDVTMENVPVYVYWGFVNELADLPNNEADITSSPYFDNILSDDPMQVNYTATGPVPKILWFARPTLAIAVNKWQDSVEELNGGSIGGLTDMIHAPRTVGNYKLYNTGYKTFQFNTIILTHV